MTKASFRSSTVHSTPGDIINSAYEPAEEENKETAAVVMGCSRNDGPPCIYKTASMQENIVPRLHVLQTGINFIMRGGLQAVRAQTGQVQIVELS